MSFEAALRPSALRNIGIDDIQEDFAFIVGDDTCYCPRFIARLLSRRILLQHSTDASISEWQIETEDRLGTEFPLFSSLGQGSTIEVHPKNRRFLRSISRELDNSDLLSLFLGHRGVHKVCTHLDDDALPFIASQFYELKKSELDRIPLSTLYHILSHPSLTISSEIALYSYLRSRLSSNPDSGDIFQFVHFEYLSLDELSDFVDFCSDRIDSRLWSAFSPRLPFPLVASPLTSLGQVEFPFDNAKSLDGIIQFLTDQHGGNVHDKGIVTITSKSIYSGELRNLADLTSKAAGCFSQRGQTNGFAGISTKSAFA
jgi:hypothetical protein